MTRAVYPGSFDPFTNGHLDIINRSISIFEELVVLIPGNPHKHALFSKEERVDMIKEAVGNNVKIKVEKWDGLVVDYAKKHDIKVLIRGLRAVSDFEYEFMMAATNKRLAGDIDTMFMMTSENLFFVNSSMVKELVKYDADISIYVPESVKKRILEKWSKVWQSSYPVE